MKILHNINRIEAFSDAVFAFAATLLVVSLSEDDKISVVAINWVEFVGFLVSFFVLVLLWRAHCNFFRRTQYVDNWIIAINAILLFVVLYIVFPLKSMINSMFIREGMSFEKLGSLFVLYGVGIALIFLCFSLMYFRTFKKDNTNENLTELRFYFRHFFIFVVVALISVILALFKVGLRFGGPGFIYFLLGPLCHFHAVWFDRTIRNKL